MPNSNWQTFVEKIDMTNSDIILFLNPQFENLPLPITRFDDPFFPFSKEIISATQDLVAGYMFDMASYLAMGGAGAVALERTIRYVPRDRITILHGPFTGTGYSPMADVTGFGAQAITVTTPDDLMTYTENVPHAAFMMTSQNTELLDVGGIYVSDSNQLLYKHTNSETRTLRITDDAILYTSKLDNFAQVVREKVSQL
ncbi:MAG: hypothetical protein AAFN11_02575 [Chloroflexota bacterium]